MIRQSGAWNGRIGTTLQPRTHDDVSFDATDVRKRIPTTWSRCTLRFMRTVSRFTFGCAASVWALACGAGVRPDASAPSPTPHASTVAPTAAEPAPKFDVEAVLAREPTAPRTLHDVSAPGIKLQVPSAGEPNVVANHENFATVYVPIGAATPVECAIFRSMIDLAASSLAGLPAITAKLSDTPVVSVAIENGRAILFSDHLRADAEKAIHESKVAASSRLGSAVLCVHHDVGYRRAFDEVVRSVVRTVTVEGEPTPTYTSWEEVVLADRVVGLSGYLIYPRVDGRLAGLSLAAGLIPAAGGGGTALDGASSVQIDARGKVFEETGALVIAGKTAHKYTLEARKKKGEYAVKGEADGKPYDVVVAVPEPIVGIVGRAHRVRGLMAAKRGDELTAYRLDFDSNPPKSEKVTIKRASDDVVTFSAESVFSCSPDARGTCVRLEGTMAGLRLLERRVFESGTFPAP